MWVEVRVCGFELSFEQVKPQKSERQESWDEATSWVGIHRRQLGTRLGSGEAKQASGVGQRVHQSPTFLLLPLNMTLNTTASNPKPGRSRPEARRVATAGGAHRAVRSDSWAPENRCEKIMPPRPVMPGQGRGPLPSHLCTTNFTLCLKHAVRSSRPLTTGPRPKTHGNLAATTDVSVRHTNITASQQPSIQLSRTSTGSRWQRQLHYTPCRIPATATRKSRDNRDTVKSIVHVNHESSVD
ncbi:hypothetical protein B0H67DRAFT_54760 [Lasiosphaeris hirsuta]|uniref:Uncharacterized protein n=1 Tax=Lasiosphaeris hirsuta TaxID=260670 RepID=A0AA40BB01_9PEZI|nr:hypothetical protein B0H67DRAFT_54760 [Lasiosphaeris hirsuta]